MKVILTGATGFIGGEVLTQCLSNTTITSLIILSRRPIEHLSSHPKAKVIIMSDFKSYPESVIREISDADACIWAMGTYDGKFDVEVEYPTAFAKAILQGKKGGSERFRYVHLGGAFTVEDQEKTLWFLPTARRGRGLGEFTMRKFAQENGCEENWETVIVKPGGVLKKDVLKFLPQAIMDYIGAIRSDECAASMIDVALNGSKDGVLKNRAMLDNGRAFLGR
ncbi:nucleoside-diphosphate-sugar epimeras-like protein [Halenospora varia]|nr:nucleoside-diphosphate-sugar epimeras-like protein [Halenospora varia]